MNLSLTHTLSLGLLCLSLNAAAAEPEATAPKSWSTSHLHQQLARMPSGDAARGAQVHQTAFCASCHGQKGEAPTSNWPNLAGQRAEYTYKMLLDYHSGLRNEDARSELMVITAQPLSQQEMADLAVFYEQAGLPAAPKQAEADTLALIKEGDPARLITPCASCHGLDGQGGKNETPAIAGQTRDYFVRTMKLYHSELRANDNDYAMRAFAMPLRIEEIEKLADYYTRP